MYPRRSVHAQEPTFLGLVLERVQTSLCPSLLLLRNVWMCPRRSVHAQEPTQGRSRSQLSRNGATFHLRSPDLLKIEVNYVKKRESFLTEILQDLSPDPANCAKPKRNNSDLVKNCLSRLTVNIFQNNHSFSFTSIICSISVFSSYVQ